MKIQVAVLFGGKSVEHEISVISALQAMNSIPVEKYDIIPGSFTPVPPCGRSTVTETSLPCLETA